MVFTASPECPSCESWNVRVTYAASGGGGALQETESGDCRLRVCVGTSIVPRGQLIRNAPPGCPTPLGQLSGILPVTAADPTPLG